MIRRKEEIEKFLQNTDFAGAELQGLAGDASMRRYVRAILPSGKKAMIMDTPVAGENFPAFVAIAEYLCAGGYSAPKILARDMEKGFLLLEDLGDESFTKILAGNIGQEKELYAAAIDLLAQWSEKNSVSALKLPFYDEALYMREVSLFCDWFLPRILGESKAADLREKYLQIWQKILQKFPFEKKVFVHRDYHADNLMWLPERESIKRVGLLDFQDAVLGDAAYDLVSLLEDARRDVAPALAEEMISRYARATGDDEEKLRNSYDILGAQRNSKIIGIFVRLLVRDGKENYLRFLPRVWKHLERDLSNRLLGELREFLAVNVAEEKRYAA